jgi:hypothetical protein
MDEMIDTPEIYRCVVVQQKFAGLVDELERSKPALPTPVRHVAPAEIGAIL